MKFVCDKCNTRYSIADERVRGRVLKIRCKACNHVITVREEEPPPALLEEEAPFGGDDEHTRVSTAPPPSLAGAGREESSEDWFVSFDGEQEGPLPLARAIDRVRHERPSGKECFCWRAGFFVWLPVDDVAEFAPALARSAPPPLPRAPLPGKPPAARPATGQQAAVKPAADALTPAPLTARPPTLPPPATGPQPKPGAATGPQAKLGAATGPQAPLGVATGPQAKVGAATGPQAPLGAATGPQAKVGAATRPQAPLGAATGPQAKVGAATGPQAKVGAATGPQAKVGPTTGPQAPLGAAATGPQAKVAATTGPQAKVGPTTGPQAKVGPTTGPQAKVGPTTGPQAKVGAPIGPQGSLPLPLPPLEPLDLPAPSAGAPSASLPLQETRPEPRLARKHDDVEAAPEVVDATSTAPYRPTPAVSGPTQVQDDMRAAEVPRAGEGPQPDTGPKPLPPPPLDDLPIGEASGLISLAHLAKPSLAAPSPHKRRSPFETFGGVPTTSSANMPSPLPEATGGGTPWMKWAALAGALATVGLTVTVVLLMTRKPTVIVVPPAPTLDEPRVADKPITVADPGPATPPTVTPLPSGADHRPTAGKHGAARAAATPAKGAPATSAPAAGGGDSSRLASLYRDETAEHAPHAAPAADNGAHGGGQVSQAAIMAVPTQNRRSLSLCYDRVLKHDATLKSGRILVHVKIGLSGGVTGVSVPDPQYAGSEIGQCLVQTIKRWHFPSSDAEYETEFPIILQAN